MQKWTLLLLFFFLPEAHAHFLDCTMAFNPDVSPEYILKQEKYLFEQTQALIVEQRLLPEAQRSIRDPRPPSATRKESLNPVNRFLNYLIAEYAVRIRYAERMEQFLLELEKTDHWVDARFPGSEPEKLAWYTFKTGMRDQVRQDAVALINEPEMTFRAYHSGREPPELRDRPFFGMTELEKFKQALEQRK